MKSPAKPLYTPEDVKSAQAILDFYKRRVSFTYYELEDFMWTLPQTAFIQTLLLFGWQYLNDVQRLCESIVSCKLHSTRP